MKKICGIYYIKNLVKNIYYIGLSRNILKRWCEEKRVLNKDIPAWNEYLWKSWHKYGADNFEFVIIEECDLTKLDERERYWISYYDSYENGYNLTRGGEGALGHTCSEETRAKIGNANRGMVRSEADRMKLSESHKGIIFSEEHRKKLSEANIGRTYSDEQKTNMMLSQKTCMSVYCIELCKVFTSLRQASREVGVAYHHIKECCEGIIKYSGKHPITGEPLHWIYASEQQIINE